MSALIRESHANNQTPLWLSASIPPQGEVTELLAPSSITTTLTGSFVQVSPSAFTVYPTKAGNYYDVSVLFNANISSGTSGGYDVLEIGISVDGGTLGATIGSWVTSQQIGYGSPQRNASSVRLYCGADSTLRLYLKRTLLGGSTAVYDLGIGSITISPATPA